MDIARTLFFCLYAYCLCGFEGNIGYSTYRRIDRNQSELCSCSCSHCRRGHIWILFRRALYTSACLKRSKTFVEAYARCITENITKRWLRQTLVVERGIAVSYKYNPLASVPVPEICVPVLCSRAQKVAVIVIKRKCRLIPDLPAPVAQLFVRWGSVDFMTNLFSCHIDVHIWLPFSLEDIEELLSTTGIEP